MRPHLATIMLCLLATPAFAEGGTSKFEAGAHFAADAHEQSSGSSGATKPRVLVSTDFPPLDVIPVKGCKKGDPPEKCSDPDDVQSMVRFLLYTNEFDVEGLVASAGTFANIAKKQNILDMLNLYDRVADNLRRHDPRYPTAEKLRSVTREGRSGAWGWPSVGTKANRSTRSSVPAKTARLQTRSFAS